MATMLTVYNTMRALKWTAIGTNLYIFGKWNLAPSPPKEAYRDNGTLDRSSPAFQAHLRRHQQYMRDHYTLSAHNIDAGRWHTLLTSAFSHRDTTHLAVNMFMLSQATAIAGAVGLGPARLTLLALGSALGGSAGALLDNRRRGSADDAPVLDALGASGMVQGMLVATACAAPRLPMNVMFIPVDISYGLLVAGFIAWDLYRLYEEREKNARVKGWSGSYTAYAGHLGGAAFGAVFYLLAARRGRVLPFGRR